jgi:hypothetical protein
LSLELVLAEKSRGKVSKIVGHILAWKKPVPWAKLSHPAFSLIIFHFKIAVIPNYWSWKYMNYYLSLPMFFTASAIMMAEKIHLWHL